MKDIARAYLAFSLERTTVTPGRLRLRVPAKRTDGSYFREIAARLGSLDGVLDVQTNAKTASILILHDDESDQVLLRVSRLGLFKLGARHQLERERPPIQLSDKERATLRFLTFAGFAVYQAWQGKILAASSALVSEAQEYWSQIPGRDASRGRSP